MMLIMGCDVAIEVCASTKEDIQALARRTKVIINMLDVSDGRGEMVIEACAGNGTHYLDSYVVPCGVVLEWQVLIQILGPVISTGLEA